MKKQEKTRENKGITLIALVITIVVMLILAGVTISTLTGSGLFDKAKQANEKSLKAEMKEQLILALQELQIEKLGKVSLDDITQEWASIKLGEYEPIITDDTTTNGKKVTMSKKGVIGKFLIDEKLNVIEIEDDGSTIEFSYDVGARTDNKVDVVLHVRDRENGITKIEFTDIDPVTANGSKEEIIINYSVEIGTEYTIKITSESGEEKEKTILISEYWHQITKNIGEGINIGNSAEKAEYGKPYQAILIAANEYVLDTLTVTMGGQAVTVDKTTGIINIDNVTGDIVITATAKKLEIQTTDSIINTSTSATSSAAANSITKGTTLYINFTATLNVEGGTYTVEPAVPYAVTRNGTYNFTVTGTYGSTTITKEIEVNVDQFKGVVGLVQYDAGEWTQAEIAELQSKNLYNINISKTTEPNFTFGGFTYSGDTTNASYINDGTIITSRNQSVVPEYPWGTPMYDGWQILESEEKDGKTYVTKLVHAGSPENFVIPYTTNSAYVSEFILSNGDRQPEYNTYQPRNWDMYKDKSQLNLIEEVHAMTYDEALAITESESSTDGIRKTGAYYWLASAINHNILWRVAEDGTIYNWYGNCLGVRPVVSLKTGVYIVSGSGIEGDPYVLGIE